MGCEIDVPRPRFGADVVHGTSGALMERFGHRRREEVENLGTSQYGFVFGG